MSFLALAVRSSMSTSTSAMPARCGRHQGQLASGLVRAEIWKIERRGLVLSGAWGDSEAQTAPTGGAIARSATDWDIPQESAQTAPTGGAIARSATDWDIPPTGAGRPVMRNGDAIDIDAGPKTVRPAPIPTASFVVAMRYRPGSMLESSRSYRLEGGSRAERKYSTLVTHCLPSVPRSPFLPSWHWLCRTTTAGT